MFTQVIDGSEDLSRKYSCGGNQQKYLNVTHIRTQ